MSYDIAQPTYSHPDEKQRLSPRDRGICSLEFDRWLQKQTRLMKWNVDAKTAIVEVIRMYDLAQRGLLGVTCFCGQLASGLGSIGTGRADDYVGLCDVHLTEYNKAQDIRVALANAAYQRRNPPAPAPPTFPSGQKLVVAPTAPIKLKNIEKTDAKT